MKSRLVFSALACVVSIAFSSWASAQITATLNGDVRVAADLNALPTGGLVGDENGGFTSLVIGVNNPGTGAPGVENWALMGFDASAATGETVSGATLTIGVQTGFGGGTNHGTADDFLNIHEMYATNAGWDPGGQGIQNNATNVAAEGVVSFNYRGHSTTGNEVPWQDASGANVDIFIGAFSTTPVGTSVAGWVSGEAPGDLSLPCK